MSGTWGQNIRVTVFGESHGPAIGAVVDGLPAGLPVDEAEIAAELSRRAPGNDPTATKRKEADVPRILSGVFRGVTTGSPVCAVIENSDTRSRDYGDELTQFRPGHADYTGFVRYAGHADHRGGGHFSGRLTAPIVFAGALCDPFLSQMGIAVGAHIASVGMANDALFDPTSIDASALKTLKNSRFPLLLPKRERELRAVIDDARLDGDSVGAVIECAAVGVPAGVGDPFFDSVESTLASLLFSVPAVKGVEFGAGFALSKMRGSEANDPFSRIDGRVVTDTNNNGGINGGITNGMPVIVRVAIKPTPSIAKPQRTVAPPDMDERTIEIKGRHDPCIAVRAVPVIEAVMKLALVERLTGVQP